MYIFFNFSVPNVLLFDNFCVMTNNFWVDHAHKNFSQKFNEITFLISYCEEMFRDDFIVKHTAVLCGKIKFVFSTLIFGTGF